MLTADRNKLSTDWDDVCCVTAAVTDEKGVLNPRANDVISFKISGPGVIAAVANGDRTSHESFQDSQRSAFQGQCMAILKTGAGAGRQITLIAAAPGLSDSSITIESIAPAAKNSADTVQASPAASPSVSDPGLPTLFIIGDSTVKNSTGRGVGGLWGWGNTIAVFFDKTKINVENRALGGRSSRSFHTEGLWDKVLAAIKPGDFVMMQFGHNDGGPPDKDRARGDLPGIVGRSVIDH